MFDARHNSKIPKMDEPLDDSRHPCLDLQQLDESVWIWLRLQNSLFGL